MRRLLLVVVAACALLAGCKVDTTLTIDVHDNGGGSVRIRVALDADAVQNAQAGGGRLEDRVRLGDLQAAGWTVSPWRRAPDGSATVSLRKDFAQICEAIIENCPNLLLLHFPTNGYLSDKIVAATREILRMGPEKLIITVSTDGDEAMNDRIRGVEGGWRRQIETFRRLRELDGVHAVLGMTLSAANVDHFPVAFAAAKQEIPDLDYRDFHVNIVHESGHYLHNADLALRQAVDPQALARATEDYARLRGLGWSPVNYLERAYLKRVRRYLETGRTPMRCHALRSSCFIDSWGNVFPCTIYDRKVGSLRETDYDLARIWQSDATAALQQEIWDYKCPHCWTPCEAYQSILGNVLRPGG